MDHFDPYITVADDMIAETDSFLLGNQRIVQRYSPASTAPTLPVETRSTEIEVRVCSDIAIRIIYYCSLDTVTGECRITSGQFIPMLFGHKEPSIRSMLDIARAEDLNRKYDKNTRANLLQRIGPHGVRILEHIMETRRSKIFEPLTWQRIDVAASRPGAELLLRSWGGKHAALRALSLELIILDWCDI